jgi:hypothetical protein
LRHVVSKRVVLESQRDEALQQRDPLRSVEVCVVALIQTLRRSSGVFVHN